VELLSDQIDAVFLTPAHQYPTGVPLHPHRRRTLGTWARTTGGVIVEDDYDGEYRYDRQPVGAFQAMAPDATVYCGTASKTLGPALRLAWFVLPPHLVAPVVQAKYEADLFSETLGQLVLADLIATHAYDRHIRAARHRYRRRRELLVQRVHAIPGLTLHGVPAGLHTLLTGTADWPDEPTLIAACENQGIALRGFADHYCEPDRLTPGKPPSLVVGFGAPTERAFPPAVEALHTVLTETTKRNPKGRKQPYEQGSRLIRALDYGSKG
jgi:GntR family transcriptional regulator/MocR family aminotransferase